MTAAALCRYCSRVLTNTVAGIPGSRHCDNRQCNWCRTCVRAKEREAGR